MVGVAALPRNERNAVTRGVWRVPGGIRKAITAHGEGPASWASSTDPAHWNYWEREAMVYEHGLPEALGLGAPRVLEVRRPGPGEVELLLEDVPGRHADSLRPEDLVAAAGALGRSQGRADLPRPPWLSQGFLQAYGESRDVDFDVLHDEEAWQAPLVRRHLLPLRAALVRLHAERHRLYALAAAAPRTVCHLDAWPANLVRRPDGEPVLLDWAFAGDGALGEDVANLIPDAVFDCFLPVDALDDVEHDCIAAYLAGLRDAGHTGDERAVRRGLAACAVKYHWLAPRMLAGAHAPRFEAYGGREVSGDELYAARAAGLRLVCRWADEALRP
jgi:hypothetical protein